ncbi:MAG: hypothetical protein E6230_11425 [Paenibacillus dendritiformis]|uniref:hypothetical protein n=1 Tax=Paenibacillus dendritiformis TaxID=130049 RepID=UPI00143D4319|nr:hypothetical protein [Paenibacillus dendritiformis]MDU5142790.1 hypothetical protein [Paenibacillus dendritiformis]NKI23588.1 hypothetical protein [Paenibacillus dendritiformis]NRF99583.1 hypothetical protein [Paenibacillus dendritiformis]GIO70731.1 hypothetical protein J27TS7_02450 [Paenibacillus dendritiformis]
MIILFRKRWGYMVFIFVVLALSLFFLQLMSYHTSKNAVDHFADQVVSLGFLSLKSFIGVNLSEYFPFPSGIGKAPAIVMFASPSCDVCHKELEKFLVQKHKTGACPPLFCFVEREDHKYERFIHEFEHQVPLIPVSKERLADLQISNFPTFFVVDSYGIIRYPGHLMKEVVSVLQDKRKMKQYQIA